VSLPAHWGTWPLIQFRNHFFTPWTSDQPVARPLSKHKTTQTQNKCIHALNIHTLSGIRTHDPSTRASEDSSCLRQRSHCDRPLTIVRDRNNEQTPWSRVIEKLAVAQMFTMWSNIYITRRISSQLTQARHWTPFLYRYIQWNPTGLHYVSLSSIFLCYR
jgi:hypothetical protein